MRTLRSRRGMAVLAAIVVLLFLFRPGVYRLRNRIAGSIGSALGRKVELNNVHLHLLPRPAFDLEGLVIYDDPAFSAEPMVRAQEVSAAIRIRSLLRGRLEIARLSATEPSINLVRNRDGQWNLTALLERNARIPVAPTSKAPSERRPAFPYLEAVHARINFKVGQEKKPYALTDADVGLWQESENSWGARMKAQPVRTDFNLTDTGLIELKATWQRAERLHATPLQVTVRWEQGQLGQITKLLSGRDRGWRGGVSVTADLSGTPEALQIQSEASIADFHRYDILGNEAVRLSANCAARYSLADSVLSDLRCEAPLSSGTLKMTGKLGPWVNGLRYDLTLAADRVPLTSLLRVLRQSKKQLPPDLTATGLLKAEVRAVRKGPGRAEIDGQGMAANVKLASNGGADEIAFGDVPLKFVGGSGPRAKLHKTLVRDAEQEPAEMHLRVAAFPLALGGPAPASAGGWVSLSGYRFALRGEAAVKNLYRLANTIGLSGARPTLQGLATVDLNVAGVWQGFAPPVLAGTAQLHAVRAEVRGLHTPIEIESAAVALAPDSVSLRRISARTASTHWSGRVSAPRPCPTPDCGFRFDLSADHLSAAELHDWFTAHPATRPWYRLLSTNDQAGSSPLLAVRAGGTLRVSRFELQKVVATQLATQFELNKGKITLSNLRAQLLQGTHQGDWTIDVSEQPVRYRAAGTLQNISLTQISALMDNPWVTGLGDASFEGTASGNNFADLLANAQVQFQFVMKNGTLSRVESPGSIGPLSVHKLSGTLGLDKAVWELSAARLESHDGLYQVSGRAAAGSGLNFTLRRSDERSWLLFGTLAKPRLERANPTQAEARAPGKP